MNTRIRRNLDIWIIATVFFILFFTLFLLYPLFGILKESVINPEGDFTLAEFIKFFSRPYYSKTIFNSFKVSVAITAVTLLIGIPFSYF